MENPSNVHTRSQAESRKTFFNRNETDKDITLSQQFEAAQQHGFFSAKKYEKNDDKSENQNSRRNIENPHVKRKLVF